MGADDPATWMPAFERVKVPTRTAEDCKRAERDLIASEVAPQHRMNAYEWPGGGGRAALLRGDSILHFAGCSAEEKVGLVAMFAGCTGDISKEWPLYHRVSR